VSDDRHYNYSCYHDIPLLPDGTCVFCWGGMPNRPFGEEELMLTLTGTGTSGFLANFGADPTIPLFSFCYKGTQYASPHQYGVIRILLFRLILGLKKI
jgi:hypothetical protein